MFKRRRFPVEIILACLRWYCKYGISYRDLAEMMQERGVEVNASTIMRWVHRYAPELEKRVRWYQGYRATSWRVDEMYVKVGGKWKYLFRTVDKHGRLIDFMLSDRRNTCAAHRFLSKALTTMRHWPPSSITTDQLGSYPKAISRLQREGKVSGSTKHRTCKYLNNIIEAHHSSELCASSSSLFCRRLAPPCRPFLDWILEFSAKLSAIRTAGCPQCFLLH